MTVDRLKQELAALDADTQRQMVAFLVSLQDARNNDYLGKLAAKIDRPDSEFATLEELDRRLGV